jgi:hypothetical protein
LVGLFLGRSEVTENDYPKANHRANPQFLRTNLLTLSLPNTTIHRNSFRPHIPLIFMARLPDPRPKRSHHNH